MHIYIDKNQNKSKGDNYTEVVSIVNGIRSLMKTCVLKLIMR